MSESVLSPAASPTIPILEPKFSLVLSTEPITAAPEKSAPDADAPAANTVSVPTDVMFGCAAVVTVPAVVAAVANATVPTMFAATTLDSPPASPMNTLP